MVERTVSYAGKVGIEHAVGKQLEGAALRRQGRGRQQVRLAGGLRQERGRGHAGGARRRAQRLVALQE